VVKNKKKAIFFDFGDTLASTNPPYILRKANLFRRAGYNIADRDFEHAYLKADCEISSKHKSHGSLSTEEYTSWFFPLLCKFLGIVEHPREVRSRIRQNTAPKRFSRNTLPGVLELLDYLKEKGYTLGIVSNNDGYTERKCKDLEIDGYFDIISDSTNIGYVKPDPRIFEHTLNKLGLEPEHCLHVGDMYGADVVGAKNAGIEVVWFNYRGIHIVEDSDTPQVESLIELKEFL